jgi:hypothetical protein
MGANTKAMYALIAQAVHTFDNSMPMEPGFRGELALIIKGVVESAHDWTRC